MKLGWILVALLLMLSACVAPPGQPTPTPTPAPTLPPGMNADQAATLGSLELVDDYPLYTMHYVGP